MPTADTNLEASPITDTTPHTTDVGRDSTDGMVGPSGRLMGDASQHGSTFTIEKSSATGTSSEHRSRAARQQIDQLLDPDSFQGLFEMVCRPSTPGGRGDQRATGDGVVGFGTIDQRAVCVFAQESPRLDRIQVEKVVKIIDLARKTGCPVVGLYGGALDEQQPDEQATDGGATDDSEDLIDAKGDVFRHQVHASGVIPQIAIVVGLAERGSAFSAALSDFLVMIDETSQMMITGPGPIAAVTGKILTRQELGGSRTHAIHSGTAHYVASDELDAIGWVQELLGYLPQNNLEEPPVFDADHSPELTDADRELDLLIPDPPDSPYDVLDIVTRLVDDGDFFQIQSAFAPNVVTGFGRIDGHTIGVVANQPLHLGGCLDIAASEKAARFIRTCNAFNVPVLTLVDSPGFLPGAEQEQGGIVSRGAKLIFAYAEASVPLVTVITRRAFDGAQDVMGSKCLGVDVNLAWPTARLSAGPVRDRKGRENHSAPPDSGAAPVDVDTGQPPQLTTAGCAGPYLAADHGLVDRVIAPRQTRIELTRLFGLLRTKRQFSMPKKHGNTPL